MCSLSARSPRISYCCSCEYLLYLGLWCPFLAEVISRKLDNNLPILSRLGSISSQRRVSWTAVINAKIWRTWTLLRSGHSYESVAQFWRRMFLKLIHMVGVRKSEFTHISQLLMFPQVWSRAWCSYNLNWDFLLLSWKVEDSNSALWVLHIPWEVLKSSVHPWRVAAPSRDAPPGRAARPVAVKVSPVWHTVSNTTPPFLSWFLGWDQFLPLGNHLADLATVSVVSCGHLAACPHPCQQRSESRRQGFLGRLDLRGFWASAWQPI